MRRKDREITEFTKMLEIIKSCDCCRLGLADKDGVYIVPMNFGYEVKGHRLTLYFHGAKDGRKMTLLEEQREIAFELDTKHELVMGKSACRFSYLYQSVMGKGQIQILQEADEKRNGLNRIMEHYTDKKDWEIDAHVAECTAVMCLQVTEWSCKAHEMYTS